MSTMGLNILLPKMFVCRRLWEKAMLLRDMLRVGVGGILLKELVLLEHCAPGTQLWITLWICNLWWHNFLLKLQPKIDVFSFVCSIFCFLLFKVCVLTWMSPTTDGGTGNWKGSWEIVSIACIAFKDINTFSDSANSTFMKGLTFSRHIPQNKNPLLILTFWKGNLCAFMCVAFP